MVIWLFFLGIHLYGAMWGTVYYGVTIFPLSFLMSQSYIIAGSSRVNHGYAWGIIATCSWGHATFALKHLSWIHTVFYVLIVGLICYTLLKASLTKPVALACREDPEFLEQKIVGSGFVEGNKRVRSNTATSAIGNTSGDKDGDDKGKYKDKYRDCGDGGECGRQDGCEEIESEPSRLCPACLTDKSMATTHCRQCDRCVVGLDHHCPWVHNCVGRGNRRLFVLFCMCASIGCLYAAVMGLYVEYYLYCSDINMPWYYKFFLVQACTYELDIALLLYPLLGGVAALSIGALAFSQLMMVANETTTYDILKQHHSGYSPWTSRSARNVVNFLRTGVYSIKRNMSPPGSKSSSKHQRPAQGQKPDASPGAKTVASLGALGSTIGVSAVSAVGGAEGVDLENGRRIGVGAGAPEDASKVLEMLSDTTPLLDSNGKILKISAGDRV
jgi:hypothetical protein